MRNLKLAGEYGIRIVRRVVVGALVVFLCAAITGCNAQQKAQHLSGVLKGLLAVAQAGESGLPAADVPIVQHWVTLGFTLDNQLDSCIAASGGKNAKISACFNIFASGFLNPAEETNLRITSATSQSHVQLWGTAAIALVNTAFSMFGGTALPVPSIAAPVKTAELREFVASSYHVDLCPGGTPEIHGDSATSLTVTCR